MEQEVRTETGRKKERKERKNKMLVLYIVLDYIRNNEEMKI